MGTIKPSVIQGHESTSGTQAYHATALAASGVLTLNGGSAVTGAIGTEVAGLDVATKNYFAAHIVVTVVFGGTVAATSGIQINAYRRRGGADATRVYASTPSASAFIPATASATKDVDLDLDGSQDWQIVITNTDATNGVTSVAVTIDYTFDLVTA